MGGVRVLEGTYDGTKYGAVMVNGLDDRPFGPMFQGPDCVEQVEHFREWMTRSPWLAHAEEMALGPVDIPDPTGPQDDPRAWPDSGLTKLVRYWKATFLDENGNLDEEALASVRGATT